MLSNPYVHRECEQEDVRRMAHKPSVRASVHIQVAGGGDFAGVMLANFVE
jgi:hypothetical protein